MLEIVPEPLTAGTVLAGTYRLERILGQGGMGVVWAARDETSKKDVAVKVLADDRATDPTQQARILREASATMTIDHPNIVKISAVLETEGGVPFIVMERLDGESLRELLLRRSPLDVDACRAIVVGICDAIIAAHAAGIVHRDLKPENVFLPRSGGVKVLDFGIAKRLEKGALVSLTETGAVLGTPYYMAPEQVFADEDVDARADIWSLGVIVYECLAGRRPTEADGFGPILKRITSADFEVLPDTVPARLASLTMRMLSRDRAKRPPLAEVRAALTNLDEPSPASRARSVETSGPRRRSAYAIGAVIVAAAGFAFAMQSRLHGSTAISTEERAAPPGFAATDPSANSLAIARLLNGASLHQQARDGKACLADLDAFDRMPNRPLPASTDLDGNHCGVRATCLMLVGECEEGKKLYRQWIPRHSPPMDDRHFDGATEQTVRAYCPKK